MDLRVISSRDRAGTTFSQNGANIPGPWRATLGLQGSLVRHAIEDDLADIGWYSDRPLRGTAL